MQKKSYDIIIIFLGGGGGTFASRKIQSESRRATHKK